MCTGKPSAVLKLTNLYSMNNDHVYLFLTHIYSKEIVKEFKKLQRATERMGACILLYQQKPGTSIDRRLFNLPHCILTDLDLTRFSEAPYFADSPACFKPDRSLILFSREYKYDYYWLIEYDVRFSGNWEYFFRYFYESPEDFLTSHIRRYAQEPDWPFWNLDRFDRQIDLGKAFRSFNPIFRISYPALEYVCQMYLKGWTGIYEALIPTLLFHGNFTLRDFGGAGEFVLPQDTNRFYLDSSSSTLLDGKTMRYRPPHAVLSGYPENKLIHPVKPRLRESLLRTVSSKYFYPAITWDDFRRFFRVARLNGLSEAWRRAQCSFKKRSR